MVQAAERMKAMRERRRARGMKELRLVVPDARSRTVRRRVARQVAALDRSRELEALKWIEAVAEFDDRLGAILHIQRDPLSESSGKWGTDMKPLQTLR